MAGNNQAAMAAVETIEKDEKVIPLAPIGHNSGQTASVNPDADYRPPVAKQDVRQERIDRTHEIHQANKALATVKRNKSINDAQVAINELHGDIGIYQSGCKEALERATDEHRAEAELLDCAMREAVQRRDAFIETLNEEIAEIRTSIEKSNAAYELRKGTLIRQTQEQIDAMQDMIARHQRFLGDET